MKCTFSLRRLGLVAHKHYAENRTSYLYGALALLGLLGLCAMLSLTGNVKHIASFEAVNVMIACVAPIAVAKLSLHDSMMTGKQIGYYTLPATDGEKFLFALLNTLVLSALAVATFEVVASIISDSIPQGHFHKTALVYFTTGVETLADGSRSIALILCKSLMPRMQSRVSSSI